MFPARKWENSDGDPATPVEVTEGGFYAVQVSYDANGDVIAPDLQSQATFDPLVEVELDTSGGGCGYNRHYSAYPFPNFGYAASRHDGAKLVYERCTDGMLLGANIPSSDWTQHWQLGVRATSLDWSPDLDLDTAGDQSSLVYRDLDDRHLYTAQVRYGSAGEILPIDTDSYGQRVVRTGRTDYSNWPYWSPNGTHIVYYVQEDVHRPTGDFIVIRMAADGSDKTVLGLGSTRDWVAGP